MILCSDFQRTLHHDEWFLKRAISNESRNRHVVSYDKKQTTPGKLQRHLWEVRVTLPPGKRHLALVRTCALQNGYWSDGAERARSGTDGPGTSPEPRPFREGETLFRRISTDADIKPTQTPVTAEETQNATECSMFHAHSWPWFSGDQARRPSELEACVEDLESTTIAERQKGLVTIDELHCPTTAATTRKKPSSDSANT